MRKFLVFSWALVFIASVNMISVHSAQGKTFKIATISPDGLSWVKKMRKGTEEITQRTEGRVKFKLYPGGVQGDDATVLRKMKIGQLHGGVVAAGSFKRFYTDLQIYNLPLSFQDYDEVDYIRERMDKKIIQGLDEGGIVSFSLIETGFAYILSSDPVSSIEDLRKLKPWVPNDDPVSVDIIQSFDISPIPLLITDVLAGLQTGLINAVAVPPIVALALQWHNHVSYVTKVPLVYIYSMLALDKKTFSSISVKDQLIVKEVMNRVFYEIDKNNREGNINAYEVLLRQGVKEVELTDLPDWKVKADRSVALLVETGKISQGMLDILNAYLKEARSSGNKKLAEG